MYFGIFLLCEYFKFVMVVSNLLTSTENKTMCFGLLGPVAKFRIFLGNRALDSDVHKEEFGILYF